MSRAFVKEGDAPETLPEVRPPEGPNPITQRGREALLAERDALLEEKAAGTETWGGPRRAALLHRLAWLEAHLPTHRVVEPLAHPERVQLGVVVRVDQAGVERGYEIVGDDEVDAAWGRISWRSPLAQGLMGRGVGDIVEVNVPGGQIEVEILELRPVS